jgi:predicted phosphodiesterase
MRNRFVLVICTIFILLIQGYGQPYSISSTPDRIILNLTTEPFRSMAVTWRTIEEVKEPQVQIADAGAWKDFTEKGRSINAKTENIQLDNDRFVWYYSAIMDGLKPKTLYAYRVGSDSVWSEWNQFTTAESKIAPLKFVFLGDPQNNIKEHVSRVFRAAFKKAPDANFWLFSGDLTSEPEDKQYEEFYYAADFIFRMIPSIMVPGNHDNEFKKENGIFVSGIDGKKQRTKIVPPTWRGQFTLPENGISGFGESSYYLDYQGVRVVMMNSNDRLQEQAVWLEEILSNNPNPWTVVSFHHPLYSAGGGRDERATRDAFLPIFDKYQVDLVLTGHDHAYSRSYKLKNGIKVNDSEQGTVYVVTVSGPKMYEVNSRYANLMVKMGGNVQLFQVISVDGNKLTYQSFTVADSLYDSFELVKAD